MAERRLAVRPAMQLVGLDEDGAREPDEVRSAPERLRTGADRTRTWAERRPAAAAIAALLVVTLTVVVGVGVPRWISQRERTAVLGAPAFEHAVHSLVAPPRERWTAAVDGSITPILVGDVVVAVAGTVGADRRILGLDAVAGRELWSVPLGADPVPTTVLCRVAGADLVCVVGPAPPPPVRQDLTGGSGEAGHATLLVVDPVHGTVLAHHRIAGWVVSTATQGADIVVAAVAFGLLTVRRLDPRTAEQRWQTQRFASASSTTNGRVRLVVAGGLVLATGIDITLVLDARTGKRLPRATDAAGADETRLFEDGVLARTQYRLRDGVVRATSSVSDGNGTPWLTADGVLIEPDASDGTSGLVFTASGFGSRASGGGVRAYRASGGKPLWLVPSSATMVAVDADGRVVLRGGGALVGLDTRTGEQRWARDLGSTSGATFTDGRRLAVLHDTGDGSPTLVAVRLADGSVAWEAPLPAGTSRFVRLGTQLYAVGDDAVVALR